MFFLSGVFFEYESKCGFEVVEEEIVEDEIDNNNNNNNNNNNDNRDKRETRSDIAVEVEEVIRNNGAVGVIENDLKDIGVKEIGAFCDGNLRKEIPCSPVFTYEHNFKIRKKVELYETCPPSYAQVGAQKAGSTTLFNRIQKHEYEKTAKKEPLILNKNYGKTIKRNKNKTIFEGIIIIIIIIIINLNFLLFTGIKKRCNISKEDLGMT